MGNIYSINQELGMSVLFIKILRLWRIFEIINGNNYKKEILLASYTPSKKNFNERL